MENHKPEPLTFAKLLEVAKNTQRTGCRIGDDLEIIADERVPVGECWLFREIETVGVSDGKQ